MYLKHKTVAASCWEDNHSQLMIKQQLSFPYVPQTQIGNLMNEQINQ